MLLETERLLLTEFTMDMAKVVSENSLDEDTQKFVPDEVWESEQEAAEVLEYLIEQYGSNEGPLVYPIITKGTNQNIGYVQIVPLDDENHWEVGYHVAKKYTGNGYATEAVKAFLPIMAKTLGISEVAGICLQENGASIRVLEKCGFTPVFKGIARYQHQDREVYKAIYKI